MRREALPVDWTIAMDDLLTERLRCCTYCGGGAHQLNWAGIAVLRNTARTLVLAYVLCRACRTADPTDGQVIAHLERRYGFL
jgi:hypothetical protein